MILFGWSKHGLAVGAFLFLFGLWAWWSSSLSVPRETPLGRIATSLAIRLKSGDTLVHGDQGTFRLKLSLDRTDEVRIAKGYQVGASEWIRTERMVLDLWHESRTSPLVTIPNGVTRAGTMSAKFERASSSCWLRVDWFVPDRANDFDGARPSSTAEDRLLVIMLFIESKDGPATRCLDPATQ